MKRLLLWLDSRLDFAACAKAFQALREDLDKFLSSCVLTFLATFSCGFGINLTKTTDGILVVSFCTASYLFAISGFAYAGWLKFGHESKLLYQIGFVYMFTAMAAGISWGSSHLDSTEQAYALVSTLPLLRIIVQMIVGAVIVGKAMHEENWGADSGIVAYSPH